ncbi:RING finger protein 145-like isoform X2 [Rhea pennata]|uniref:RING finger protein 145-like isoform X2 n=1 Tax=Rhea pennata TaxID=8795 RepID=UPI002E269A54
MSRLEAVANVALRVPGLALLELLYRWDAAALGEALRPRRPDAFLRPRALRGAYCLGHVLCVVVLMLPVRSLVKLYLHLLTALLLSAGHQTARDYIRRELESEFQGAVYDDPVALGRFVTAVAGQLSVCTLCSLVMRTRQAWLFAAPLLPLLARLCGFPLHVLPAVNTFATMLTVAEVLYVVSSHILVPFQLAAVACRELVRALEAYRLVALGVSLWCQLAVPLVFLVFWLVLFSLRLSSLLASSSSPLAQQGLIFVLLSSVAECCSTPYSLIGLTFTVSYLALGVLNLCKFYLLGYGAFQNGNVMHSIILFIVVTSTLQSMIEIADPIVLALGASRNRSPWKHFRGVSMCLFLLVFPCFMAYKIAHFFHLDFWLLILVSSCMLTSLQVMGTLFIYALFMVELFQDTPLERMDEIIYCVNAVSRVLEFLVAVCVVGYGTWESLFGEWSWMGASVIIIHSYFNVWLRAQSGWKSFLLRREAAKKISSLPRATRGQLRDHNDVCAICFQDMQVAVITPCNHFFHGACLRKWLYVQDTCPMCHQQVQPAAAEGGPGAGDTAEPEPDHEDKVTEDGGASASPGQPEWSAPVPAQPWDEGLPPGPLPGQGGSRASPGPGAAHPDASTRQEQGMGTFPEPCGAETSVQDTQHPVPAADSPQLGAGHSGGSHSSHGPS